jgi:hypothetical protein
MRGCNLCSNGELLRSHRRSFEFVLAWFGWYPYRCDCCQVRQYQHGNDLAPPALPAPEAIGVPGPTRHPG